MTDHGPECPCESCVELSSCYTVGPDGKIDRVFVHGPYGPPYETVTFEEAMKGLPSPFVPPLEPTPAREFLRELDALTGFEGAESPLPEGALERALQKLGITNPTGHALGCRCGRCAKTRAESLEKMKARVRAGEKPETLGELLAFELRKRKEQ